MKQLVIPRDLVPNVLNFIHDCATSSHPGKEKTYKQAQLKYYWTDMRKQIYNIFFNGRKQLKGTKKKNIKARFSLLLLEKRRECPKRETKFTRRDALTLSS